VAHFCIYTGERVDFGGLGRGSDGLRGELRGKGSYWKGGLVGIWPLLYLNKIPIFLFFNLLQSLSKGTKK
jgi:hypothetical protein